MRFYNIYRRIAWNNRGKQSIVWRCVTRVEHGPQCCDAPAVQEVELQEAVVNAINQALGNRDSILMALEQNITEVLADTDNSTIQAIDEKLRALQKELLKLANAKKDYTEVADEIDRLRQQKQDALMEKADREGLKQRIKEMKGFLTTRKREITTYNEQMVRRLIEKITVYDEKFEVEFKSGTSVEVER